MPEPLLLLDLGLRIAAAIVFGAAIGLERQWRLRTAGIRTNALVSVGAALFVVVGAVGWTGPGADPTRVAAQVVSGIGFLGAGVILRDGLKIRGLTTAATLWCAAAVGSLAGAGMYAVALLGTLAIVATNTLLRPLSRMVNRRTASNEAPEAEEQDEQEQVNDHLLELVTTDKSAPRIRALLLDALSDPPFVLRGVDSAPMKDSKRKIVATVGAPASLHPGELDRVLRSIGADPKVQSSRWSVAEADE
jgi:putative Mg2+ transporter-C (MgtC) family protein